MGAGPRKALALDTNVLLDLASGEDFAHDFKDGFLSRGYEFLVPPTVVAELAFFAKLKNAPQQELAGDALVQLGLWRCEPFALSAMNLSIASGFASRLINSSLIPESESNDGKILAQASLGVAPLLVTSDRHLLGIDESALLIAFGEAGLMPVYPSHPKRLLRALE